jgi:hypothetical protein
LYFSADYSVGVRSAVGRSINSTLWPTILSCDTAGGRKDGVRRRVVISTYLGTAVSILVAVAGIALPIGLGETVGRGSLVNVTFEYATDPSIFGGQTPLRDGYKPSRACDHSHRPCPGVNPRDFELVNETYDPFDSTRYKSYVVQSIVDTFGSGTRGHGDLRVNPFEIQFRQYMTFATDGKSALRSTNVTGDFFMLDSVLFGDKLDLREGVIIDGINGGIGFRNHTVPVGPSTKFGATWTEELLWIEPETVCADTNWTIEYSMQLTPLSPYLLDQSRDLALLNRGGFEDPREASFPWYDKTNPQSNADLNGRAHMAAWMFGLRISQLLSLNTSNSSKGTKYNVSFDSELLNMTILSQALTQFGSSGLFLGYLWEPEVAQDGSAIPQIFGYDNGSTFVVNGTGGPTPISNATLMNETTYQSSPGISNRPVLNNLTTNFTFADSRRVFESIYPEAIPLTSIVTICRGFEPQDAPDINRIAVSCGFMFTPPQIVKGNVSAYDMDQRWNQSVQVCASAPRAIIKEVSFLYNKTGQQSILSDLRVTKTQPKTYSSEKDMPHWGVENPGPGWNVSEIQLMWGIVNESFKNSQSLWTAQKEHLYLPAFFLDDVLYADDMVKILPPIP